VEECNPPKLTLKTEEFRGGGMNAPLELTVGMEKMDSDFTLVKYDKDILGLFSVVEGKSVPFVIREVLESFDGTITTVIHTMRGKIKEMDPGASKPGDIPKLKISMALSYYKLQHGGTVVHEIDVENMIQVINGADALAAVRTALGI
jgi:P2 family phage contractile tail tube protein